MQYSLLILWNLKEGHLHSPHHILTMKDCWEDSQWKNLKEILIE